MIFITFKTWHISCATGVFLHCEFSLTDESLLMHSWPAVIHRHFSQIPGFWGRILSRINPHWNQNSSVAVISHIFTWLLHTLNSGAWLGGVNLICHLLGQEQGENEHFKHFKFPVSAQQTPGRDLELNHPRDQIFSCSVLTSGDQEFAFGLCLSGKCER